MTSHSASGTQLHVTRLFPRFRFGVADLILLAVSFLALAALFVGRAQADLALPQGLYDDEARKSSVATFASPLLREAESPMKRPVAKWFVKIVRGISDISVPSGVGARLLPQQAAFARTLHQVNVLLLAAVVFATFIWLKFLLDDGSPVPAVAALLLAVSPWHAGMLFSAITTSELLSLLATVLALICYTPDPVRNGRSTWILAPFVWSFAAIALLSSEFAAPIFLYCVVIDLIGRSSGVSLWRHFQARFVACHLFLIVATLLWIGVIRTPEWSSFSPIGAMDQLFQMLFRPFDPYDFFIVGRRPAALPTGYALAGLILIVVTATLRARHTIYRTASLWLLLAFAAFLPAGLPTEHGGPFFSYSFLCFPAFFLLIAAATFLTEALPAIVAAARAAAEATESSDVSASAPAPAAPSRWSPELQSSVAILAIVLALTTVWRLFPTIDARSYYRHGADRFARLPELAHRASVMEQYFGFSLPRQEKERRREAGLLSADLLLKSLSGYLELRKAGYTGPIDIPSREFREQAAIFVSQKQIDSAVPFIEQAVALEPDQIDLKYELARLYMAVGRKEEAKALFAEALDRDPDGRLALELVQTARRRKDHEKAAAYLAALQDAPQLSPEDRFHALLWLGTERLFQSQWEAAVAPLEEARKLRPRDADTSRALLSAYAAVNAWEKVKAECGRADKLDAPIPSFREVVESSLRAAYTNKDDEAAASILTGWVDLADRGRERSIALMNRGLYRQKRPEEGSKLAALEDLRAAIAEAPDFAEAHKALSRYYLEEGFADQAGETLERGYELQPENMELLTALATYRISVGQSDAAAAEVRRTIERMEAGQQPKSPEPYRILASIYAKQSTFQSAIEQLEKARALAPNDDGILLPLVDTYDRTDDYEKGATILTEMLQRDPDRCELYVRLIRIFQAHNDFDSALEVVAHAVRACPESADVHVKGGEVAVAGRNLDIAQQSFVKALDLEPDNVDAKKGLELVQEIRRRADEQRALVLKATAGQSAPAPGPAATPAPEADPVGETLDTSAPTGP